MARQSKLTPETQRKIVEAIAEGNYLETAAALGGVTYTTLNNWMRKGQAATSGPYVAFFESVKRAEAEAESTRVGRIKRAGQEGNWQADAWYLERRYPERWGKRIQQELSGPNGGPIKTESVTKHDLTKLSTDQLRTLRTLLAEAKPDDPAGAE
jgi:transposase-like protein